MTRLAGYGGSVLIGTATSTGVKSWTLDQTFEELEVTGFNSGGRGEYIPGISRWRGGFEGYKEGVPLTIGTQVALDLRESQTAGRNCTGSVIIIGFHPTVAFDGVVAYSYDFVGTGTLYIQTA